MTPTPHDVDVVLAQIETEDERQKEALRKFMERERNAHVTGWDLLKAFLYIAGFGSLFAILFVRWLSGWRL